MAFNAFSPTARSETPPRLGLAQVFPPRPFRSKRRGGSGSFQNPHNIVNVFRSPDITLNARAPGKDARPRYLLCSKFSKIAFQLGKDKSGRSCHDQIGKPRNGMKAIPSVIKLPAVQGGNFGHVGLKALFSLFLY